MIKELSNKYIYEDFVSKTTLTEEEQEILDMLILKYSIVKMAQKSCMSDRNVSRIIRELKDKYKNYKDLELAKLQIFRS